ncbi:MAG: uroporphyrinogen-III C-methyltransferase [Dehalococcoidia bacterium]|nr:uroporphyrinogen-III C-methyltransferase [Dehalococcoidia bacterium]
MTVYLVGAGPGDPKLLTLRGRELLECAEVVLHDHLVDRRVLDFARPQAQRIYVRELGRGNGQAPGVTTQDQINAALIAYGRQGKTVVRLKGGDPFVFGRGGEEASALAEAGVPYEVVPGVTSAVAVPAAAGIPVTQRGMASSVAIVTGHEAPHKGPGAATVDWAALATATDTLVVLMGLGRLEERAQTLIAHGRPPDTPAAVIANGTWPGQRTVTGRLDEIADRVADAGLQSPAVIVVGEVVHQRDALAQAAQAAKETSKPCG